MSSVKICTCGHSTIMHNHGGQAEGKEPFGHARCMVGGCHCSGFEAVREITQRLDDPENLGPAPPEPRPESFGPAAVDEPGADKFYRPSTFTVTADDGHIFVIDTARVEVFEEIEDEIQRAETKHGTGWPSDALHGLGIIAEELGEAFQVANDLQFATRSATPATVQRLRAEVLQVACTAARFLQHFGKETPRG